MGYDMAVEKKPISSKKKKLRRVKPEEEIVITLGKPPEEKSEEEIEEVMEEEPEEELEEEDLEEEETEEDVVVISIGKPSVEEEEVVEEVEEVEEEPEIIEEEAVEVELEEEEGEKPAEGEEAKKMRKLVAIIIAIAVVIGSIGVYTIFLQNKDPIAKLQLSSTTAFAGELIMMDGSNSTDDKGIVEYTWNFGDDRMYSEESGSAQDGNFDGKTTHSYEEGDYTVELTVRDEDDRTGTTASQITVTELVVTIPYERIGDDYSYDVNGSVEVDDEDGIWTGGSDLGTFTLTEINIDYIGYMISSIEGVTSQEDGFGEIHDTLERYNYEDLGLSGTISGTATTQTQTGPVDVPLDNIPIQDGELEVTERSYVDLNTNKTIFSDIISNFILPAGADFEVTSYDHIRSYSNLREKPAVLRVEDLSQDRTFKMDDSQTKIVGDIAYTWEVEKVANIKGYPSLGIKIDIDGDTKNRNSIEEFEMWLWITNDVPLPVKTYIYAKVFYEGTTATIVYNNEIQQNGFVKGTIFIPYGGCSASSPDDHYHFRNPDFEFVNWDAGEYIPKIGSNGINFDFSPQEAINFAQTSSSGFLNYLGSNTEAYVIDGHYNETDTNPLWNLTFGEHGDETGYYVVVEYTGSSYLISDEGEISISGLRNSTSDFDLILSFSAGKHVFERHENINSSAFDAQGNVRFNNRVSYGARANIIYPSISITLSLTVERTGYGYYLNKEKEDSSFSAAVDAINGQLIYVWDHEGEDILSLIF
jgi:hypothetical protein